MSAIRVLNGVYRNKTVRNVTFTLVKGFQTGSKGGFVTVKSDGYFGPEFDVVRIRVDGIQDIEYTAGDAVQENTVKFEKPLAPAETDEQAMDRIRERFEILTEMTKACVSGDIRAMIVSGPPGVGKSFGVEQEIDKATMFDKLAGKRLRAEVVKGSANGHVPVFDAPDDIASVGHIVFQPFAGNASHRSLPPDLIEKTVQVLRQLPCQVFVVTRSYVRPDLKGKTIHAVEDARALEGGNIKVLDSLTVPATLNLIKSSRAYVGSWSSLQQAAWLENKPVAVFYPEKHHDATRPTPYAFGMNRDNTLGREYPDAHAAELSEFLQRW